MTRVSSLDKQALKHLFDAARAEQRAGRLDSAKAKYAELLRRDPKHADAAHLLAQILFTQGDAEAALALLAQAIAMKPRTAGYRVTLSVMLNRLGRAAAAEAAARRALALDRRDTQAHVNLGIALIAQDTLAEAERALTRALQLAPGDAVALANLGAVHLKTGRPALAADTFRRAVAADPDNAVAWANLAEAAHDTDRADEALAAAQRALALDPRHAPAHATMGVLRHEAGAVAEAIAYCERAVALRPNETKYVGNLANALLAANRPDAALAAYDRLLAAVPGESRAVYNKGLCQLLQGDLDAGLENYEARWGVPNAGFIPRALDRPSWNADAPTDARLFVWAEQGIGDHLFNAGFLPALLRLGVRCAYECDPRLVRTIARSFPAIAAIPAGAPPPEHDYQIPAGSLLRGLRARSLTSLEGGEGRGEVGRGGASPPHPTLSSQWEERAFGSQREERESKGWLRPDPSRVAEFRERLAALGPGLRVGISWRSARKIVGAHKSMPLAEWGPIFDVAGVRFVNLQYGDTDAEIAAVHAACDVSIHSDPDLDRFADIDELAALVAALDLVITTSNVTAHIAGALGRPAWVVLQKVPLWYWELAGEESRYYPSLRLFRQTEVGRWTDVARRLAAVVQEFARTAG